ncbi:ABC transporter ATP-binding protein [Rhodophyticola sp. CCM32]|nr:ABC transporter ATP-binding protein [Rhodophyticola sp. CCM32]
MITLEAVQKYYGEYHALRGITAEIGQGEFFSLLGPSGCGKTTLLRAIAGFEEISAGRIVLDGRDMEGVPPNRRPTNMVFQSYAIFPHLSVAENVGFGLRKSPMSRAGKRTAIGEALEMVGLEGYGTRAAHALSGGQRQRVALARALILKPKVLLLDEPLSALDKKMREQMQTELRRLQRQVGITFILVTHDQEEALIMSDRIAVMFEGQIAQLAPPQDLYRRPANRQVGAFVGMMNFLPATVTDTSGPEIEIEVAGLGRARLDPGQCPTGTSGAASIGLRPESMTLVFDGQSAERVAQGVVEERIYYGDMTYYDIRLEGTTSIVQVSMRNMPGRRVLERGDRADLAWDARAMVLFT